MNFLKLRRVVWATLFVCGTAMAAPHASVPSVATVGRPVAVTGGGFNPGALISVRVTGPGDTVSMAAVVVAADGSLTHTLVVAQDGAHRVQLLLADGSAATPELLFQATR
ncbi:hypothetical protein D621_02420 [beta proteobacterium AAP51]|nr:hypothetical protein D621_02420 [beta proteobacterium AAP51]